MAIRTWLMVHSEISDSIQEDYFAFEPGETNELNIEHYDVQLFTQMPWFHHCTLQTERSHEIIHGFLDGVHPNQ
jgi:hypothetical protein